MTTTNEDAALIGGAESRQPLINQLQRQLAAMRALNDAAEAELSVLRNTFRNQAIISAYAMFLHLDAASPVERQRGPTWAANQAVVAGDVLVKAVAE